MDLQDNEYTDGGIVMMLDNKGPKNESTVMNAATAVPPPSSSSSSSQKNHTPMAQSSSASASPSSSNNASSESRISDEFRDVLNLSFPKCSCCQTGWYDAIAVGNDDHDDDDDDDDAIKQPATGKRKRHRERPSHYNLYPMPKCACITRLALAPSLPTPIIFASSSVDYCNNNNDPSRIVSQIRTHSFPNLAICKSCLKHRIAASKEVTVHDYRMEHVPNGQRNVKFTVEADCVQCKKKFMGRVLEKLLNSGGRDHPKNNVSGGNNGGSSSSTKRNGKTAEAANWWDAVKATIQFVGWAKREKRRERRRLRRRRRDGKMSQSGEANGKEKAIGWWGNHHDIAGGDDNCSSDECYSISSDSCDEWQSDDDDDDEPRPSKGPHRLQLKSGELMEDLLRRDPKFRQEHEDEQYVKKVMQREEETRMRQEREDERYVKRVVQREEERRRVAEESAREDRELAMRLQAELNEKDKEGGKGKKLEPKSPILDAWRKASSSSNNTTDGKQSPAVAEASPSRRAHATNGCGELTASSSAKFSRGETSIASSQSPVPTMKSTGMSSPKPQSCSHSTSSNNDESIDDHRVVYEVVSMGFKEASARRCLKDAHGNVQLAVSMLLSEASEADG